ncbi:polysaccharide pyruvyl transferase family protein [Ruania alba]|uniref:Polysaccharide pyruvyl transferase domain-containing protein n=1 Tax=Ruania alba TaxID=648782 RepID=A0A1H5N9E0_9MICO|nr:polysaccharide pyruvyl transferase family protein [Ruania alba]SEE98185.1 hypothetical protein SAMN04488554_4091 [Ruania alba]
MDLSHLVVCSFYTADDYYREHARTLQKNLDRLGISYEIQEIQKNSGEDWADICRKKIPFLANVCEQNPDKKVFWIDVDCQLLELPTYVAESTADLIGFQRGFGSPMRIGYAHRTRFWEPCFFGINTTIGGRKFIKDAQLLESSATIKATDDYFFEESWRSNAARLTFQVIPSASVLSKASAVTGVSTFFSFGSSGNVSEFKGKVTQHDRVGDPLGTPLTHLVRRKALLGAKAVERRLPSAAARPLRRFADTIGITHALTGGGAEADRLSGTGAGSPHRARITKEMVMAGQRGDLDRVETAFARLSSSGIPSEAEIAAKRAADTYAHFVARKPDDTTVPLVWWPRPFPGNFGDWLSPLIVASQTDRSISYVSPTARSAGDHLISIGSIGRFIRPRSFVIGTGVSSTDIELDATARYFSVRGPITAQVVADSGGPQVESWGDPGALLSRVLPLERGETNGRIALVRHFTHANLPLKTLENMDELSVLLSHPDAVQRFLGELIGYDAVVTSAMHVMIACHSYGIPCALITFEGFESSVHGTGIKYQDYCEGMGLSRRYEPIPVGTDLRTAGLNNMITQEAISTEKLDEIEAAVREGVSALLDAQD